MRIKPYSLCGSNLIRYTDLPKSFLYGFVEAFRSASESTGVVAFESRSRSKAWRRRGFGVADSGARAPQRRGENNTRSVDGRRCCGTAASGSCGVAVSSGGAGSSRPSNAGSHRLGGLSGASVSSHPVGLTRRFCSGPSRSGSRTSSRSTAPSRGRLTRYLEPSRQTVLCHDVAAARGSTRGRSADSPDGEPGALDEIYTDV